MKSARPLESEIIRATLDACEHCPDIIAWRQNTGAFAGKHKGKRWFVRFGIPGQADIGIIIRPHGRFGAAECKRRGEKPRPEQIAYLDDVRAAGGVAFWFTSVDEFFANLKAQAPGVRVPEFV